MSTLLVYILLYEENDGAVQFTQTKNKTPTIIMRDKIRKHTDDDSTQFSMDDDTTSTL